MENIISSISSILWGPLMITVLLGTGVYFTLRLRFIQIREFLHGVFITLGFFEDPAHKGDIKHFQALTTALSATVGTGNIAGVATAIVIGGPGAVFWIWITGFFGMALKYSECLLAMKYRVFTKDGTVAGGPMYYLDKGLGSKPLAYIFAFCTAVTAFFIGNMVQSNSVAEVLYYAVKAPHIVTGITVGILVWLVIIGGIRRIGNVTQFIVPLMCAVYVICAVYILATNMDKIFPSIIFIIKSAFKPMAAAGGFAGSTILLTMRMGIARGIFSNEAGLGSAPIAHAAAKDDEPVRQGLVALLEPFIDTIVICSLTGMVIVITGAWDDGLNGAQVTQAAFNAGLPGYGELIVGFGLLFFALSTIIGWSYYGDRAVYYLLGEKFTRLYKWVYCFLIPVGAIIKLELIWNLADIANACMAFPNLVGLLGLSGIVVSETRNYVLKRRSSFASKFHYLDFGG